jgi:hypothetical protein
LGLQSIMEDDLGAAGGRFGLLSRRDETILDGSGSCEGAVVLRWGGSGSVAGKVLLSGGRLGEQGIDFS